MAGQLVAGAIASSQIDTLLEEAMGKISTQQTDLSIPGGNDDGGFAESFSRSRENAKMIDEMQRKMAAEQRLQAAKAFAVRQGQVGSPGNIKAPARIRNRV